LNQEKEKDKNARSEMKRGLKRQRKEVDRGEKKKREAYPEIRRA